MQREAEKRLDIIVYLCYKRLQQLVKAVTARSTGVEPAASTSEGLSTSQRGSIQQPISRFRLRRRRGIPFVSQADLEISLFQRSANDYGVTLRYRHLVAGQDKSASGSFVLNTEELLKREHDPADYGEQLAAQVFAGEDVRGFLNEALAVAAGRQTPLHLRLFIHANAQDLHSLHWETLRLPGSDAPLATGEWVRFSRYLDGRDWRPVRTAERDALQAVIAVASPDVTGTTLAEVRTGDELAAARTGLGDIPAAELAGRGQVTLNNLLARLRDGCDILYLVAHGMLVDGEPQILLEREDGGRAWASGRELAARLGELAQPPSLVVLVSCQSAGKGDGQLSTRDGGALAGLGPRLATAGVPAVVAMQGNLAMATAAAFMPVFLRELRRDGQVDRAMAVARGAVRQRHDWWMPVLYTRLSDGRIFGKRDQARSGRTHTLYDKNIQVPSPPEPMKSPDIGHFVGREREIAYFTEILETSHFAVIAGMPGVGKTALAARLASQVASDPDHIFWHQFHEGEGIEVIVWRLAGLLARNGQDELWLLLQYSALSGSKPPPIKVLLDYLHQLVRGRGYVICLDDFHHVEDDPLVEVFLERIQELLPTGEITIIITSREVPTFVKSVKFDPLRGFDRADMQRVLRARDVNIPPALVNELHRRTDGNAELVTLAIEALRQAALPERVIERLIEEDDIEGFLLREVDQKLRPEEKVIMNGVAVLLGLPGTRDAIEATLDTGGTRRTLLYLSNRYLLLETQGRFDREYAQHAILQAFYYDLLSRKERLAFHRRAAEYYERAEPDQLRAAMHYQHAGEGMRAAELATADIWAMINQGQGRLLRSLLIPLGQERLDVRLSAQVQLALGEVLDFLGESQAARAAYEAALAKVEVEESSAEMAQLEARACLGMGAILEHQATDEALHRLEQGLAAAGDGDALLQAALHNRIGSVRIGLAEYDAAIASLQHALSLLPDTATQLRTNVLINLGTAYGSVGDTERSSHYTAQALAISRQLNDLYSLVGILSNIGIDKEISGDWAGAGADYQEALQLAEHLGSLAEQARIHNLLGTLRLHQGAGAAAEDHLQRAIALFRQIDNPEYLAATLPVLAKLRLRQQQREAARAALAEAEALATAEGWDYILPETYATQAHLALAEGDPAGAQERAEKAIAIAAELELAVDEGKAWRAKGMALAVADQAQETLGAFEHSLVLLAEQDPYETAQTQLAFAHILAAAGDANRATLLRHEAETTLLSLGGDCSC
jgi:tetratricopeptide (TPR) repeat protein